MTNTTPNKLWRGQPIEAHHMFMRALSLWLAERVSRGGPGAGLVNTKDTTAVDEPTTAAG